MEGYDQIVSGIRMQTGYAFIIIIIDEFGDLILSDKENKKIFEDLIAELPKKDVRRESTWFWQLNVRKQRW